MRQGDTLSSIAASLWGDASLWYKLAEANGMGANQALSEGQSLIVPTGVMKATHNARTFAPYDPTETLGETAPTTPVQPKPKKNKCGGLGQVLLVVIAIVVVAYVGPQAIRFFGNMLASTPGQLAAVKAVAAGGGATLSSLGAGGAAAVAAGSATAAAAGSIVSQGIGVATGIQDKFSWNAVALTAIGAGVGAGLGIAGIGGGGWQGAAVRGALGSSITQGVGVATGLQKNFSWAAVAAAGLSGGVGHALGAPRWSARLLSGEVNATTISANLGIGAARAIAAGAARSLIEGSDFGDNVLAALPDVIGQTIGESIAGRIAGNGGAAATTGEGERRGGVLSAIGDFLGFDGEFGYDGVNGPTGTGRDLGFGNLGDAFAGGRSEILERQLSAVRTIPSFEDANASRVGVARDILENLAEGSEQDFDWALAQARERDVSRAALVNMVDLSERVSSADGTNLIASLGEQERVQLIESFGRYTSDLMSAFAGDPDITLTPRAANAVYIPGQNDASLIEAQFGLINLLQHEGGRHGGHTVSMHVGLSHAQLRAMMGPVRLGPFFTGYKRAHSSFPSLAAANALTSSTLAQNAPLILAHLASGSRRNLAVGAAFGAPTGVIYYRPGDDPRGRYIVADATAVQTVIRRNDSMPHGFGIVTSFPSLTPIPGQF